MRGNSWLGWLGGVGVLMGSVFLVTFLNNFITQQPKAPTTLTGPAVVPLASVVEIGFVTRNLPADPSIPALIQEINVPGFLDFWFTNDNTQTATFGLERKNCTCSSVEVFLIPDAWLKTPEALAIGKGKSPTAAQLAEAGEGKNPALAALLASLTPKALENQDRISNEVPPGGIGVVRLRFKNDKAGPITLSAKLWYGKHDSAITTQLEIRNEVLPIMRADTNEVRLGLISNGRSSGTGEVIAYSSTRTQFDVAMEPKVQSTKDDIITIKGPTPLDAKELAEFAKRMGGPVKSAYRFIARVQLPKGGLDNAQTEFGPFIRPFRLVCRELEVNDIYRNYPVNITGSIESEIRVFGANNEGLIEFRNFPSELGKKVPVRLETSKPDIKLEIDAARTSPFIKVVPVGKPEPTKYGMGYDFEIVIPPNKVNGAFPRSDDPQLSDSAFYFRTVGKTPRLIRVPVTGRADG
jgi:hypothetical protein